MTKRIQRFPNSSRILAQGQFRSNITRKTHLNNNDLIVGPSGAGKTRSYVKPNLMQCEESVIVADTKGSLIREVGSLMAARGYQVINLDFTDLLSNTWRYNPLHYIRYGPKRQKYSEQDIIRLAETLNPVQRKEDPFWDESSQYYLATIIAYVLEALPEEGHTLASVVKLFQEMDDPNFPTRFEELAEENPDSYAVQTFRMVQDGKDSPKTYSSVKMHVSRTLAPLTISNMDRSMDRLTNLFYAQAFQELCESADKDY